MVLERLSEILGDRCSEFGPIKEHQYELMVTLPKMGLDEGSPPIIRPLARTSPRAKHEHCHNLTLHLGIEASSDDNVLKDENARLFLSVIFSE